MKKEVLQTGSFITPIERLDIGLSMVERDFKRGHITKREFEDIKKAIEDSKELIKNNHKKTFPAML